MIREFPTTHVLIDDDVNYLRGISTILPLNSNIYRYFLDSREALEWINMKSSQDIKNKIISRKHDENDSPNLIDLDVNRAHSALYNNDRFNVVSTILVDYDMPGLDGIELCCSIKNTDIQKVLLTGYLGESYARHALNKGWIDMFLPKGEDSSQKISEMIFDADKNFFNHSNSLMNMLVLNNGSKLFKSLQFAKFFEEAFASSNAVEFHMLSIDGDYLFVDENGQVTGFSVQDERRRKENLELAQELCVCDEIIQGLSSGEMIFCHSSGNELPEGKYWKHFVFPSAVVDKQAGLIGACSKEIFNNKAQGIAAFKPFFDASMNDALKVLHGNRS